ncbi:hypothetical protein B0T19DRAFT_465077, partial [Cercophora scortea]
SVAFSPNSQRLASGSGDETIKIWDPTSGQCLQTLEGHGDSVRSVAFLRARGAVTPKYTRLFLPAENRFCAAFSAGKKSTYSALFLPVERVRTYS